MQIKKQLRVRTQARVGWDDMIRGCGDMWITTQVGKDGATRISAKCLDVNGGWHDTALEFPNSYNGIVQNCDGQLTLGACG